MLRKFLRPLLRGLARLFFRVEVPLQQADFNHQRLLVVANHQSFLDGLADMLGEIDRPGSPRTAGDRMAQTLAKGASSIVFPNLLRQIDRIWDSFWAGGIANPLEVIEQLTFLLFIKRLDDQRSWPSARPTPPANRWRTRFSPTAPTTAAAPTPT